MSAIVVGYDGSDSSKAALERARELAEGLGDELVLVFGYAPPGIWGGEIAEHEEAIEEYGGRVMDEAKRLVEGSELRVDYELVSMRAADAIVDVANRRDARILVVGSYGDSPLKEAILGSTPYKLLHQAKRPVLVVPATR